MDCSIVPLRKDKGLFLISTTDFFYPLVDDPYIQGEIGCANVLSDLYAMGVTTCDNLLMLVAASTQMEEDLRLAVTRRMIQGFNDLAASAGAEVTGGQTVQNPWPIIGGVAMSVCSQAEFIVPEHAQVGDVLVLTKPLGTQLAVNAHQWLKDPNFAHKWDLIKDSVTEEQVEAAYSTAIRSMRRLNKTGALLMHKHNAHAATDVTGFGFVGHANNLALNQREPVDFVLDRLPIIRDMTTVAKFAPGFKLLDGFSAETSGGLLVSFSEADAARFMQDLSAIDNCPSWIVGRVVPRRGSSNSAYLADNPEILQVSF